MKPYVSTIIFSAPMIHALLANRKSQTRRLTSSRWLSLNERLEEGQPCWLWVREAWRLDSLTVESAGVVFRASPSDLPRKILTSTLANAKLTSAREGWRSPLHMPRWASRLTLELLDIRVQKLQELSEADAIAEGVERAPGGNGWRNYQSPASDRPFDKPVDSYRSLWLTLHGGEAWSQNPVIVAIRFRTHARNVDELIQAREEE